MAYNSVYGPSWLGTLGDLAFAISKFSSLSMPWQGRGAEKIQLEVGKGLLLFLPCFPYSEPLILPTSLKTDACSLG